MGGYGALPLRAARKQSASISAWSERVAAVGRFLRRHVVFAVLLSGGVLLRIAFVVAYYPAFWFTDSRSYVNQAADYGQTSVHGPLYPAFLHLLSNTGGVVWIAIVQHAMLVGLCCGVYVVLLRRGLRPWLAALACAPLLLDAFEVTIEHYVLTEALFTTLAIGAVVLLVSSDRPRLAVYGLAGLLLGTAALSRPTALVMGGVAIVMLLVRRIGWKKIALLVVAMAIPVLANDLHWRPAQWDDYDMRHSSDRLLYSRTAQVADCGKLHLTTAQRTLCPKEPLGERPDRGDAYLWNGSFEQRPASDNPLIKSFALAVVKQQPLDYGWLVAFDTSRFLVPGQHVGPGTDCLIGWYTAAKVIDQDSNGCKPLLAQQSGFGPESSIDKPGHQPALRGFVAGYASFANTPVIVNGLCVLLVIVALVRRRTSALTLDALLLIAIALADIVLSMAVAMYDPRYGIPILVLFSMAGAMAAHALTSDATPRDTGEERRKTGAIRERLRVLGERTLARYLIAGGLTFIVDSGTLWVCHGVAGLAVWLSSAIAFVAAFIVNFGLQRALTFAEGAKDSSLPTQTVKYSVLVGVNFFVTVGLMDLFTSHYFGLNYMVAKVVGTFIITGYNFFVYRHWVFGADPEKAAEGVAEKATEQLAGQAAENAAGLLPAARHCPDPEFDATH